MAKKKTVKVIFIDDGDDLTDSAVLAGLKQAGKIKAAEKNPKVQEKISPPAALKKSDF